MAIYTLKEISGKGKGVFAARAIKKNTLIFHVDLRGLKQYTLDEIDTNSKIDGDHADYVGHGKYVINESPASFINHSCEPNCYCKMTSIAVKELYAMRDIVEGEELTHDYTATSVDQFAGNGSWVLECKCGSQHCRGQVTGDFFELTADVQRRYYSCLPPSVKRKFRARFRELFKGSK